MKKGKILYIRNAPFDINPNSYNVQEMGLGKAFCKLGYDFDCVAYKKNDQKQWVFYENGDCVAKWIETPRIRIFRWGINRNLCRKSFIGQYDIVITSEYMEIMTYLLTKSCTNLYMYSGPYYNLFTFKWFSPIYDLLFTRQINEVVKVKFVKSVLAKEYLEKKGYNNVVVTGVGLDFDKFQTGQQMELETQQLVDYMTKYKCLLYVGALSDRKNLPFMLEVYEKVLEKDPDIRFVMIGKSVINPIYKLLGKKDEDYERVCFSKVSQRAKDGILRVNYLSNTQLCFIYPLAGAFLLPSKKEIFGMVLLESMYLGAPVITSKNGGSVTLIKDNDCGIVVDTFDSDKWAEAALELVNNPSMAKELSERAHNKTLLYFNWDYIAKKMESYFM